MGMEKEELNNKKSARAFPLASARQHPENQKENQAGHSSERTVEGRRRGDRPWVHSTRAEGPGLVKVSGQNGFTPPNLPPGFK